MNTGVAKCERPARAGLDTYGYANSRGLYARGVVRQNSGGESRSKSQLPELEPAALSSGVVINSRRRRHRRQVMQILARVLVALHVPRGEGQQFFSRFAVIRETGNAHADRDIHAFTLSH